MSASQRQIYRDEGGTLYVDAAIDGYVIPFVHSDPSSRETVPSYPKRQYGSYFFIQRKTRSYPVAGHSLDRLLPLTDLEMALLRLSL